MEREKRELQEFIGKSGFKILQRTLLIILQTRTTKEWQIKSKQKMTRDKSKKRK